jgi:hypothetical protein
MALVKVYDINSPDGFGMFMGKAYSSPENAEIGFNEWKKRFEAQGYYRDNNRNMIPLNNLRECCRLINFEIDTDDLDDFEII